MTAPAVRERGLGQEAPKGGDRAGAAKAASPRRVRSDALLAEARELIIEHAGRDYRLRVTASGKLILTA